MRFDAMMKVGGCRACMTCFKTGKACSFDDDFNAITLHTFSILMPLPCHVYWYSIPTQIKGVIDRVFSLVVGGKGRWQEKKMGLICCCEEHDPTVMDGVRIPMERTAALLKWEVVGEVLIPGVFVEGDINKTDGCKQAAALADKF